MPIPVGSSCGCNSEKLPDSVGARVTAPIGPNNSVELWCLLLSGGVGVVLMNEWPLPVESSCELEVKELLYNPLTLSGGVVLVYWSTMRDSVPWSL